MAGAYAAATIKLAVQRASPAGSARNWVSCRTPTLLWAAWAWPASRCSVRLAGSPRQSAWVLRLWDGELAADRADRSRRDLAVPRDRRTLIDGRVVPDRMVSALAQHGAPVSCEMAFEVAASQAAGARSIVTCSA